jgi:hypothetical protein
MSDFAGPKTRSQVAGDQRKWAFASRPATGGLITYLGEDERSTSPPEPGCAVSSTTCDARLILRGMAWDRREHRARLRGQRLTSGIEPRCPAHRRPSWRAIHASTSATATSTRSRAPSRRPHRLGATWTGPPTAAWSSTVTTTEVSPVARPGRGSAAARRRSCRPHQPEGHAGDQARCDRVG